ncbi:hypothetical protein [Paenibacillus harenae]|uniref:hypothetical protein n=1 Tax=Paenibacillus harenae TaxID=306543 RepID=UPI0003F69AE9|nr:hypothetical protein [Paenibacillus harenae]
MEEEQVAYQSEQIETTEQETQTEAVETVTTQETAAAEGFTVKYNKEDRFVAKDEAPTWIQKGLNYDKVQERATQLEQQAKNLDRVAKFYGYDSSEAYLQALDQAEQDKRVQEEADLYGVPEDFIRSELQPLKGEIAQLRQEREQLQLKEQQIQIDAELKDLRSRYNDFDSYNEQIFELVTKNGYGIEHAYMVASFQDKIANTRKQAEAETIRNLQQNAETSTGALSQGDVDHKTGFANLSREEQRRMIAEVKSGTRKTFD